MLLCSASTKLFAKHPASFSMSTCIRSVTDGPRVASASCGGQEVRSPMRVHSYVSATVDGAMAVFSMGSPAAGLLSRQTCSAASI